MDGPGVAEGAAAPAPAVDDRPGAVVGDGPGPGWSGAGGADGRADGAEGVDPAVDGAAASAVDDGPGPGVGDDAGVGSEDEEGDPGAGGGGLGVGGTIGRTASPSSRMRSVTVGAGGSTEKGSGCTGGHVAPSRVDRRDCMTFTTATSTPASRPRRSPSRNDLRTMGATVA